MENKLERIFNVAFKRLHEDCEKYGGSLIYLCNRNLNKEEHDLMVELFQQEFPKWANQLKESY